MKSKLLVLTLCLTLVLSVALIGPVTADAANMNKILGRHYYLLNLLGKKDGFGSHQAFDNPDRHTIFVPENTTGYNDGTSFGNLSLTDSITIQMMSGPEFAVIDGNGMDGNAVLQLESGKYYVFVTALAKPGTNGASRSADLNGWYYDDESNGLCYLLGSISISRSKRTPISENATDLFYIAWSHITGITGLTAAEIESALDAYGDYAIGDDVWIFDFLSMLQELNDTDYYFWQLHNSGLKHIQVRFYRQ